MRLDEHLVRLELAVDSLLGGVGHQSEAFSCLDGREKPLWHVAFVVSGAVDELGLASGEGEELADCCDILHVFLERGHLVTAVELHVAQVLQEKESFTAFDLVVKRGGSETDYEACLHVYVSVDQGKVDLVKYGEFSRAEDKLFDAIFDTV